MSGFRRGRRHEAVHRRPVVLRLEDRTSTPDRGRDSTPAIGGVRPEHRSLRPVQRHRHMGARSSIRPMEISCAFPPRPLPSRTSSSPSVSVTAGPGSTTHPRCTATCGWCSHSRPRARSASDWVPRYSSPICATRSCRPVRSPRSSSWRRAGWRSRSAPASPAGWRWARARCRGRVCRSTSCSCAALLPAKPSRSTVRWCRCCTPRTSRRPGRSRRRSSSPRTGRKASRSRRRSATV